MPLATADYVRICDLKSPIISGWRNLYRTMGWKTRQAHGAAWAQPRDTAGIQLTTSLSVGGDSATFFDTIRSSPSYKYKQGLKTETEFSFDDDFYVASEKRLKDDPLYKSFYRANLAAISDTSGASLSYLEDHFSEWFFAKFPKGRIDFIEPAGPFASRMHAIRKSFQISLDPSAATKIGPPATLSKLHGFDTLYWPRDEISIWGSLFWPFITSIPISMFTCALVFHLGEFWDTREPYPPSIERWWRNEALFSAHDDTADFVNRMLSGQPPKTLFEAPESIKDSIFDPDTFKWYLYRISQVRELIADFRVFADENTRKPDYAVNLQLLLTIQRIIGSTHYLTNYVPPFLAKGLLFDIADEYASMAEHDESKQPAFFEWLFDSEMGGEWTSSTLKEVPAIGDYLSERCAWLYAEVNRSIDAGITGQPTTTRAHLVRLLRNARHGYWLRGEDLSKHFANYDANLTDFSPTLSVLWWLAFITQPWQLLRRATDRILVRTF